MTSGTITYNETALQIITDSLQLIAVLAAGETPTDADTTFSMNQLNKMVKAWMGQGIHLWTEESGTLFLVYGQPNYILQAGASGAYASDGTGTPVETTLALVGGGTSITVSSSTGMSINDTIGVVQNNQVILWTTITSISGVVITLNASVSQANAGNAVYTYTNQLPRVLSIQSARLRDNNGFDKMMEIRPREDYMRIPQKLITGDPIILYYSPQLLQGQVFMWPAPSNVNKRIEMTYLRTIQDFDSTSDTPDLPQEWLECITFNLAVRLAPAYGINLSTGGLAGNPNLVIQAAQYLEDMKSWDAEQPFIQIVPKNRC